MIVSVLLAPYQREVSLMLKPRKQCLLDIQETQKGYRLYDLQQRPERISFPFKGLQGAEVVIFLILHQQCVPVIRVGEKCQCQNYP